LAEDRRETNLASTFFHLVTGADLEAIFVQRDSISSVDLDANLTWSKSSHGTSLIKNTEHVTLDTEDHAGGLVAETRKISRVLSYKLSETTYSS
jgi:hypothetical protein